MEYCRPEGASYTLSLSPRSRGCSGLLPFGYPREVKFDPKHGAASLRLKRVDEGRDGKSRRGSCARVSEWQSLRRGLALDAGDVAIHAVELEERA